MKTKLLFLSVILFSFQINAQTLNPTASITNAGTANTFKGGYTHAYPTSGTPWNGPLISFGGLANNYDCQLNSNYLASGISYRTRNGDAGTWNAWNELATRGVNTFTGNQSINGFLGVGMTRIPQHKLEVEGDHLSSRFFLRANNGSNADANLMLWASEPGLTYTGVGIGNNVHNYKNSVANISLLNTSRGGSYIRLLDNEMRFNVMSSSGVDTQAIAINGAGNIGIGTTPSPNAKLEVNGRISTSIATAEGGALGLLNPSKAGPTAANQWVFYNMTGANYGNSLQFWNYGTNGFNSGAKFTILDGGNVGIGTIAPQSKLQVSGSITLPLPGTSQIAEEGISFIPNHRFNYDGKFINHYGFGFYPYSKSSDVGGVNSYMSGFYGLDFFTQDTNRIRISQNGNVGIGTTIPDEKLTVNGKIHATEIIVTAAVPADYVFQKYYTGKSELKADYDMPTLAEIESFTKKNHHLPNVPSAKEIQQNGLLLGEMSNVLLQKIEELTLYAIAQQKELDRLKTENESFKSLAERLSAIEKELKK